jgi:diphthamide synthase (EF-2-diphthine--ammonia ligase)
VAEDNGIFTLSLFDSGGKYSFLTVRALALQANKERPFGLVLLTTFDATSRVIAHQDVPISSVVRQAEHLGISLLGVPMQRGSSESYVSRIRRALDVIEKKIGSKVTALAFGDLHLDLIRNWREDRLGSMGYEMLYPLWKVTYNGLDRRLKESQVPCIVSASERDEIAVEEVYGPGLADRLPALDVDLFSKNGEFHTLPNVWKVDRDIALGVTPLCGRMETRPVVLLQNKITTKTLYRTYILHHVPAFLQETRGTPFGPLIDSRIRMFCVMHRRAHVQSLCFGKIQHACGGRQTDSKHDNAHHWIRCCIHQDKRTQRGG